MPVKFYFWELVLDCGHTVERRCRYVEGGTTGFGRMLHGRSIEDLKSPPKKAHCEFCKSGAAGGT